MMIFFCCCWFAILVDKFQWFFFSFKRLFLISCRNMVSFDSICMYRICCMLYVYGLIVIWYCMNKWKKKSTTSLRFSLKLKIHKNPIDCLRVQLKWFFFHILKYPFVFSFGDDYYVVEQITHSLPLNMIETNFEFNSLSGSFNFSWYHV